MEKNSFIFFRSFYDSINALPEEMQLEVYRTICEYGFNGIEPQENGIAKALFISIKPNMDNSSKKYEANIENGKKGGRPKKNTEENQNNPTETELKPNYNPNETQNNPTITQQEPSQNLDEDYDLDYDYDLDEDINNNILSSDNETSDKSEDDKRKAQEKKRKRAELYKNIIDYLNKKIGSSYKYSTKTTQVKINARLNEGYSLDDFIAVIDKKYDEWKDTEMEQYLCPDTLFGTKFEKYLNQKKVNTKPQNTENLPDWVNKWVNNK